MKKGRTNILMFSIDNLRYDCVCFQPDKRELLEHDVLRYLETPTLDGIAEKSLCFTQCVSTNTYTTAAHASILTGMYPPHHGVRAFFDTKLSSSVRTLPEILREHGYRTILYTDIPDLFLPLDLNRGFEFVISRDDSRLVRLLNEIGDRSLFLFAHFFDVHEPFLHNTNEYRTGSNRDYFQELRNLYEAFGLGSRFDPKGDGVQLWNRLCRGGPLSGRPIKQLLPLYVRGVSKFDKYRFRDLMSALGSAGILANALLAVFSDHGEGRSTFGNNEYLSHGGDLYDNVIRVPLLIRHPEITPDLDNRLISIVDISPTILQMSGVEYTLPFDGIDVLKASRETAYSETWGGSGGGAAYATSDGKLTTDTGTWPEFMLSQRSLRTANKKVVLRNKGKIEAFHDGTAFLLPYTEFVKKAYHEILGRAADEEGLAFHVAVLEKGMRLKQEMLQDFLNTEEYKSTPKEVLYNLVGDPSEDVPLEPSEFDKDRFFPEIERICSPTVSSEKIFTNDRRTDEISSSIRMTEDQLLIRRLKDLGYL